MISYPPLCENDGGLDAMQAVQYGWMPLPCEADAVEEMLVPQEGRRLVRLHAGPWHGDVVWRQPPGSEPKPLIIALNFNGNHTTSDDSEIPEPDFPVRQPMVRGQQASRWPFARMTEQGIGVATMCCSQAFVDCDEQEIQDAHPGIRCLTGPQRWLQRDDQAYGAIAAWAWTLIFLRRWFAAQPQVDASRIACFGHSRLGKASLLAGALDEGFFVVGAMGSGTAGQSPSRKGPDAVDAESAAQIQRTFPHWFCPAFARYAKVPAQLPFDQHHLLAAVAPRRLVLIDGIADRWADPSGTDAMARLAAPAWRGAPGPRRQLRLGGHEVTHDDWNFLAAALLAP